MYHLLVGLLEKIIYFADTMHTQNAGRKKHLSKFGKLKLIHLSFIPPNLHFKTLSIVYVNLSLDIKHHLGSYSIYMEKFQVLEGVSFEDSSTQVTQLSVLPD